MTYLIKYKDKTIFDIEFYIASGYIDSKLVGWNSEIYSSLRITGLMAFITDQIQKTKNFDEFTHDTETISELRQLLREVNSNEFIDGKEAGERHHHKFKPVIENKIKEYCKKYGFQLFIA